MPTLEEFLSNRDNTDEVKITLADGVETTLGDLRKGYMKEQDYRRKTGDLANQRRAFEQQTSEWEAARLDAEAKLTELAKQLIGQNPRATQEQIEDLVDADPRAKKLQEKIDKLETRLSEAEKRDQVYAQRFKAQEEAYVADQHRRVLFELQKSDEDLRNPEKVQELVEFAKSNYIPRLDWAHKLMKYEDNVKSATEKAKKEAREEGYNKAKQELLQPVLSPRRMVTPSKDAPKTLDEAADAALRDSDIWKDFSLTGGAQ
jgi:hypothetical protein